MNFQTWLEQNPRGLDQYPDHWIAYGDDSLMLAEASQEEFSRKYKLLPVEVQDRLVLFHSSEYTTQVVPGACAQPTGQHQFTCFDCGGSVVPMCVSGRMIEYPETGQLMEVPLSFELPTCSACKNFYLTEGTAYALDRIFKRASL